MKLDYLIEKSGCTLEDIAMHVIWSIARGSNI